MKTGLTIVLLLLAAAKPKVNDKAMQAIRNADDLIYRPLDQGLTNVSLTFDVHTDKGKMKCLWSYRAATKDREARDERRVLNVKDPGLGEAYAEDLPTQYGLVTYPVLFRSLASRVKGMNVSWNKSGDACVVTPVKGAKTDLVKLVIAWNDDGLPKEIDRTKRSGKGDETVERDTTLEWKQFGDRWLVSFVNSESEGTRMMGRYEYEAVKGIYLPSKVTVISPLAGNSTLKIENRKVNEKEDDSGK